MDSGWSSWSVSARNLPEHARNPIHTDAGARAAGFTGALVAGVTTYAYLTHPVVEVTGAGTPMIRASFSVARPGERHGGWTANGTPTGGHAHGEMLEPMRIVLDAEWGWAYGERVGDDLDLFRVERVVHPAMWPALANQIVHEQAARGPWVHTRSRIVHHDLVTAGSTAEVHASVVDRSERCSGEWATFQVGVYVAGEVVASIEHEAIVALPS